MRGCLHSVFFRHLADYFSAAGLYASMSGIRAIYSVNLLSGLEGIEDTNLQAADIVCVACRQYRLPSRAIG
jgi:hypothetical protein